MRGMRFRMLKFCLGYLAVVLLLACHDAKRNNPLDPDLTSAVELSATVFTSLSTNDLCLLLFRTLGR